MTEQPSASNQAQEPAQAELDAIGAAICEIIHTLRPLSEWHEDMGAVLWWTLPICEPPFVGTPIDSDWDNRLHFLTGEPLYPTHFSLLPLCHLLTAADGAEIS